VRLPFTAYRWPGDGGAALRVPRVTIPVPPGAGAELACARDPERAAVLARGVDCTIPDASAGTLALIEEYDGSDLARFHRSFDGRGEDLAAVCRDGLPDLDLATLPACVAEILRRPNDLLLQPAGIQHAVWALVALGWPPRQVAALIRSKYLEPHGWLADFHFHDAGLRAEVYTRLFAGLVAVGRDRLVDFNCKSTQEKGLCPGGGCAWNLATLRDRLLHGAGGG
jgi:hypothetical protein